MRNRDFSYLLTLTAFILSLSCQASASVEEGAAVRAKLVSNGANARLNDVSNFRKNGLISQTKVNEFREKAKAVKAAAAKFEKNPTEANSKAVSEARHNMRIAFWETKVTSRRARLQQNMESGQITAMEAQDITAQLDLLDAKVKAAKEEDGGALKTANSREIKKLFKAANKEIKQARSDLEFDDDAEDAALAKVGKKKKKQINKLERRYDKSEISDENVETVRGAIAAKLEEIKATKDPKQKAQLRKDLLALRARFGKALKAAIAVEQQSDVID